MGDQEEARLDIVVVGQTPRPDVEHLFAPLIGDRKLRMFGALDGLSYATICQHPPFDDSDSLVTFLNTDSGAPAGPISVSKCLVETRAWEIFRARPDDRRTLRILFCTGEFANVAALGNVIVPSRLLASSIDDLLPQGRLGVFAPLPELARAAEKKWTASGRTVAAEALAIDADEATRMSALQAMAQRKPDLVLLDCLTYQPVLQTDVLKVVAAPTLSPLSLLQDLAALWSVQG